MAFRSNFRAPALGSPSPQPFLPAGFGQSSGLSDLMEGASALFQVMAKEKEDEDALYAERKYADFVVEWEKEEGDRRATTLSDPASNTDYLSRSSAAFEERQQAFLEGVANERNLSKSASAALQSSIIQFRKKQSIESLTVERNRMKFSSTNEMSNLIDIRANEVITHPDSADEVVSTLIKKIHSSKVALGDNAISLVRKVKLDIYDSQVRGFIANDPVATLERLREGEYDSKLTPESKVARINEAEVGIRSIASRQKEIRTGLISDANDLVRKIEKDIDLGFTPIGVNDTLSLAASIGGSEGQDIASEVRLLSSISDSVRANAIVPWYIRQARVDGMTQARAAGELSRPEADLHNALVKSSNRIDAAAREDGYSLAVGAGVISQPVPIMPGTMGKREEQALSIKATYGPSASTVTKEDMDALTDNLSPQKTIREQLNTLALLSAAPTVAADVVSKLTKGNTSEANQVSVAMQAVSLGDIVTAEAILEGRGRLAQGMPVPKPEVWVQVMNEKYANVFGARQEVALQYKDAAIALAMGKMKGGELKDANLISTDDVEEAFEMVLPGNVVSAGPQPLFGRGAKTMTPSKSVTAEQFKERLDNIRNSEDWWTNFKWYNRQTRQYEPVETPPAYVSGQPISAKDALHQLETLQSGTYMTVDRAGNRLETNGGRLVLDLRGMQ